MKTITIDQSSFLKGSSLNNNINDKGFSPLSYGFEIDRGSNLGLLLPGRSLTEYSTGLDGSVVTKAKYKSTTLKYCLVCSNGKIYETDPLSPGTFTLKDTVSGVTFSGNSHAKIYKEGLFVTSETDIYYDDLTYAVKNKNWWTITQGRTALTSGVPHQQFEFGRKLFILNGNKIASWDGSTSKDAAFTLPTGWIITSAEVDNDIIYLTIVKSINDSSVFTETKILVWNGISQEDVLREIPVLTPAISVIKKADTGFVFWAGRGVYYFDGANYSWLRYSNPQSINSVVGYEGKIYYCDNGVSCYNSFLKAFSTPIYTSVGIGAIDIAYIDFIDIFTSTSKMLRGQTNNAYSQTFYSNTYDITSAIIRKIELALSSPLATNSQYTIRLYDETGNVASTQTISKAVDGAKSVIFRNNLSVKLNTLKLANTFDNAANTPIRYIKVYYDQSENYVGK